MDKILIIDDDMELTDLLVEFLKDFKYILQQQGVKKIDYVEIRYEENLSFSNTCNKSRLFIAMYVGNVRVIVILFLF